MLNVLTAETPTLPFSYKLNDDWFVAGNNIQTVDGFMAAKGGSKAFTEKISGHPFGMYLDFQKLLKTNYNEGEAARSMLNESAAIWQDMIATGGEMKDGAATAEIVVNMVDKKTNSLKQLNRFIERMYAASKTNKVAHEPNEEGVDSVITTPPVEATPE